MATAITILNHELVPLISRAYKHNDELDAPLVEIYENFRKVVSLNFHTQKGILIEPVIQILDYHYVFVYSGSLILLLVVPSRHYKSANVMCYLVFLKKLESLLKDYFKVSVIDQDMIIDNFLLVYELFDEVMDYGFVQITDFNILNEYIKMKLNVSNSAANIDEDSVTSPTMKHNKNESQNEIQHEINTSISRSSTTQISWRPKGLFYKKNEFFVDIVEKVNLLIDSHGLMKKQVVSGEVKVKCYLSGMPELTLGVNEFLKSTQDEATIDFFKKFKFDYLNFHQCVELSKFTKDSTIQFIPPDGNFTLMKYKLQLKKSPLVKVSNIHFRKETIYRKQKKVVQQRGDVLVPLESDSVTKLADKSETAGKSGELDAKREEAEKTEDTHENTDTNDDKTQKDGEYEVVKETRLIIEVDLTTRFNNRLAASDVSVVIPINFQKYRFNFARMPRFKTQIGVVVFDLENQSVIWKISSIGGSREFKMKSELLLMNDEDVKPSFDNFLSNPTRTGNSAEESELLGNDYSDEYDNSSADEDYYYKKNFPNNVVDQKAQKLKMIYETIQREKRVINDARQRHGTLIQASNSKVGPKSPTLLMENDEDEKAGKHSKSKKKKKQHAETHSSPAPVATPDIENAFHLNKNMVKVSFKVVNMTFSGIKVAYLKIDEPLMNYTSFPWVKYMTKNDEEYAFRFNSNQLGPDSSVVRHVKARKDGMKITGGGNSWMKL